MVSLKCNENKMKIAQSKHQSIIALHTHTYTQTYMYPHHGTTHHYKQQATPVAPSFHLHKGSESHKEPCSRGWLKEQGTLAFQDPLKWPFL